MVRALLRCSRGARKPGGPVWAAGGALLFGHRLSPCGGRRPGVVPGPHRQVWCDLERTLVVTGTQPHWPCRGDSTLGECLRSGWRPLEVRTSTLCEGLGPPLPCTSRGVSWAAEVWPKGRVPVTMVGGGARDQPLGSWRCSWPAPLVLCPRLAYLGSHGRAAWAQPAPSSGR